MSMHNPFSTKPPVIRDALLQAVKFLRNAGIPQPRLEAELLLAHVLEENTVRIITYDERYLTPDQWEVYQQVVRRRGSGYPLQYLTGKQEFMSLEFKVTPHVLIPRSDTEVLVEKVLALKGEFCAGGTCRIVDVGTGSGAIAVSLAYYWPEARVTGVDISPAALAVARENARRHQVQVEWVLGDLLTPFLDTPGQFDIIAGNPPYIPSAGMAALPREVQHEPAVALDGGPDGLAYYRRLSRQASRCLKPGGFLALEIGWDQGEPVRRIFEEAGFQAVAVHRDYAGRDRVVTGRRPGDGSGPVAGRKEGDPC